MTVNPLVPPASTVTAGGYMTTIAPLVALDTGLTSDILSLFQLDYPGFSYTNATAAANGTLTINSLTLFQNGLTGGLSFNASYLPGIGTQAPHTYQWLQFLTINPLTTPFLGATSSPFTDPPPDARDDSLPFYWTTAERDTAGLGYATGGNINDDPLFSDAPRVSDSRAPVQVRLDLYLADFDSTNSTVTIYDGLQYGFDLSTPSTASPEPSTWLAAWIGLTVIWKLRYKKDFRL